MRKNYYITLICGQRNCGKSTLIDKTLRRQAKTKRVYVYDTDDNAIFHDYKVIALTDNWTKLPAGLYKIIDEDFEAVFTKLNKEAHNGTIAFDDIRKYSSGNNQLNKPLRSLIIRSKQRGLEIIISGHSYLQLIPQLHTFADAYCFFDFKGKVVYSDEIEDIYEDLVKMLDFVKDKAKDNPHFCYSLVRGKPFALPQTKKKNDKKGK